MKKRGKNQKWNRGGTVKRGSTGVSRRRRPSPPQIVRAAARSVPPVSSPVPAVQSPASRSGDLLRRLPAAAVLIPALLWVIFRPSPVPIGVVIAIVSLAALREVFALQRATGGRPLEGFGYSMAALMQFATIAEAAGVTGAPGPLGLVALLVAGSLVAWMPRGADPRAPGDMAATVFAVLYAGFLPAFLTRIAALPEGPQWLVWLLALTWIHDTAAYGWGRRIGGAKLWPEVSPNKTRAGFWGGLLTTTAVALVLREWLSGPGSPYLLPEALSLPMTVWLAPAVGVAAVLGDLAESMLKRAAGAKDSGAFLPGHGGVLDKIDALILTAPVLWFAARLAV